MSTYAVPSEIVNAVNLGHQTLGEIITWGAGGDTTYQEIKDALAKTGMDEKFVRELCPRYAFSRACKELEQNRVIRLIDEIDDILRYQFTKESRLTAGNPMLTYNLEALLDVNKKTGDVVCADMGLQQLAERLIKDKTSARTASDVTSIVQRMFAAHADLFPVREKGGCYFVPKCYAEFVNTVEVFLMSLGGHINRFPILAGNARGNESVKTVIVQGLVTMVEEHRKAIERMGVDTRESTYERRYEEIEYTKAKVEGYAIFLQDQVDAVYQALDLAKEELTTAKLRLVEAALAS